MDVILVEADRVGDLDRHRPDPHLQAERAQPGHDLGVEIGDRTGPQWQRLAPAVAGVDAQRVVDEIEIDLEGQAAIRHRRGGQPAAGHIERHMPPMVDRGRQREADLADDLGPQMQGGAGVLPLRIGQGGPTTILGLHDSPPLPLGTLSCDLGWPTTTSFCCLQFVVIARSEATKQSRSKGALAIEIASLRSQ